MIKKYITIMILCLLAVICLPCQAIAAEVVNTTEKCTISVSFTAGDEKASGVAFKLYRIADITSSGDFSVTPRFKEYPVSFEVENENEWREIAMALSGYVSSDALQADYTAKTTDSGVAYFSHLPVGMYLVIGEQYISNQIVYSPQSFIVSVPYNDVNNRLRYDVRVEVKYDFYPKDESFGLELLKKWNDNNYVNRPKAIEVEIYCDNQLYDTVTLTKENNWKYELKNLNRDSVWTVKEKIVPVDYFVRVEKQGDRFVLTNTNYEEINSNKTNSSVLSKETTTTTTNPSDKTDKFSTTVTNSAGTTHSVGTTNSGDKTGAFSSGKTNTNTFPKTGLLWWPVPCMLLCGLTMVITGIYCRRGNTNED